VFLPAPSVGDGTLPGSRVFDPLTTDMTLGNDPQLAVGDHYMIGIDSTNLTFYDKRTGVRLPEKRDAAGNALDTRMNMSDFFAVFMSPTTADGKPNPQDINLGLPNASDRSILGCIPDHPEVLGGCVSVAYDARVLFDHERHQFWLEAALRNRIWTGDCNPKKNLCAPQGSDLVHRFVAVAVSRTEDPRDGFFQYVLEELYADWPRMGVHGPYLVVGHNANPVVVLFDADKLAKGNFNNGAVVLGIYRKEDFGDPEHVSPVVQHDKRDESDPAAKPFIPTMPQPGGSDDVPTFLVATNGTKLSIYAVERFVFDQPGHAVIHPPISHVSVDLDEDVPTVRSNPVYRDGKIYLVGDECASGSGSACVRRVRVIVVPVFRATAPLTTEGYKIMASKDPGMGFEDFTLGGGAAAGGSYEIPAVEVTKDDDFVVVYGRATANGTPGLPLPFEPGAYYSVFHREERSRRDGVLQGAVCTPGPLSCALASPVAAHIDVAGIAIDPSDDATVWMSHAFADGRLQPDAKSVGKYRMVIGTVIPRVERSAAHPHRE
jgi:hypothetical protein